MKKRQITILAGIAFFAGAIFLSRMLASGDEAPGTKTGKTTKVPVDTLLVRNGRVPSFIEVTGRIIPEDKIDLYAEVSGVLLSTGKPFKVGTRYRRSEVIMRLNDQENRESLKSQRASFVTTLAQVLPDIKIDYPEAYPKWREYLMEIEPSKSIPPMPEIDNRQVKLFLTSRNVYSQYHQIRQQEARLAKYTIRAPFDGVLTEAAINTGTLVRAGQSVGEFVKTGVYEMEASIKPEELPFVKVGDSVEMIGQRTGTLYKGRVVRINEKLDPQTQSVKIFVQVGHPELRTGMYLEGRITGQAFDSAFVLKRDYLIDDQEVFVLGQDSTAQLKTVKPLKIDPDQVIVQGLPDQTIVIAEAQNRAFEGQKVRPIDQKPL